MARCACSAACGDSISCFPAVSTRESNKGTTPRPCRWNIIWTLGAALRVRGLLVQKTTVFS